MKKVIDINRMQKQAYKEPKIEVISFETQGILAASTNVDIAGGEFNGGFNSRGEFELDDDDIFTLLQ